jgi:hypothetical protein
VDAPRTTSCSGRRSCARLDRPAWEAQSSLVPLDPERLLDATPAVVDDDLDFDISVDDADEPPRWTLEEAFAAVARAAGRDEVVAVALRYARDFFEAAALLAVSRGRVRGHDGAGWLGARERCRALSIAADDVELVRTVLATNGPCLGPVAREQGNEMLLAALGRAWPRTALVYPITLRERIVAVLYADNGAAPVSPRRVGDLLVLLGGVGAALERVVRDAKRTRAGPSAHAT